MRAGGGGGLVPGARPVVGRILLVWLIAVVRSVLLLRLLSITRRVLPRFRPVVRRILIVLLRLRRCINPGVGFVLRER